MAAERRSNRSIVLLAAGGAAVVISAGSAFGAAAGAAGWNAWPRAVHAQEARWAESTGITVIGDGVATVRPDTTTIRLGVEVNAKTPAEALEGTRQSADRVLQRLRDRGVAEADLQTSGLNVFRVQEGMRDGPPAQAGTVYRGIASITVQAQDTSRAGALLEQAMQAGATSVEGLSFGVRDDTDLRRQALAAAIQDARPKAETAAAAASLTVTGVRSIVELPLGPVRGAAGLGGGAAPGVAPGELDVPVRVEVTFDVTR
ncbi:MAG: SIMPL domain-containing protein [Chloroflexota bacterium]